MFPGFIPSSRATFIFDFVSLAMAIEFFVLVYSIYIVKYQKKYELHKKIQTITTGILAIAVLLFEIDVRQNGWKHLAEPSPYYDTLVFPALYIHIFFSVTAIITWTMLIWNGYRNFPKPLKAPGENGAYHRKLGRIGAMAMILTTVTGMIFYWLAYMAV